MTPVAYILCNQVGELIVIPPRLDEASGRMLLAQGWRMYRVVGG